MIYISKFESPMGTITIASDGENLTGLWLHEQKYYAATIKEFKEKDDLLIFEQVKKWLIRYFNKENPPIDFPIYLSGNPFRKEVLEILTTIPYGTVITYGDIAKKIAKAHGKEKMSAQAVGGAVGHNPISIIVPCHRVVGSNGSLTGYAGGLGVKVKLLTLEGVDMSKLFLPKKGTAL